MMLKVTIGIIAGSMMFVSCGGKLDEAAEAMKNIQSVAESADNVQASQDAFTKRREERKAKGDTLSISTDELKKFLPGDIDGYTASEPETQSMDMEGLSWSVASKEWKKVDGSTLKVTITDYNATEAMWGAATIMFAMKWSTDNATETSKTIQTDDQFINGHMRYGKQDKSATVTFGLGGRFVLQVDGSNQSSADFARSIAERVDMKKLASM
ncbi:MAG: hypothetical protein NTX15_06525 [Candidatus Kapabacteria bacterium]|nr:hypothetical protein [Candidatus Kapabacteria bacterium]